MNERRVLAATSLLAAAVPMTAAYVVATRVDGRLAPALETLTGLPVAIGTVDAGLTGTVRLTGLTIGDLVHADAVEASVGMASLLGGQLRADEVRVEGPRLRARVDSGGESDLVAVLRHVAARRSPASSTTREGARSRSGLRRVVVTRGALIVDLVGTGRLEARGVELHPQPGGVRLVTGPIDVRGAAGAATVSARFARAGADVSLTRPRVGRALAVGGVVTVDVGGEPLVIRGAVLGRGLSGDATSAVTLLGSVDDHGVARPVVIAARPDAVRVEASEVPLIALAPLAPLGLELETARATGSVTVARRPGGVWIDADGAIAGAAIEHPAIAAAPVALDLSGSTELYVGGPVIDLREVRATIGAMTVRASGRLRRGGPAGVSAGELDLAIDRAPCLALLESLPPTLRGPLGGLTLIGDASAAARLRFDLDLPPGEGLELDTALELGCSVVADAPAAEPQRLAETSEHVFPDGTRAVVGPGLGDWVHLDDLSAMVPGAFVAAEDARFFTHDGFDLVQIGRSLEVDLREGRFARGGSTISQQLVKNAFLTSRRSLDRKLQEAILTWRIEAVLDKQTILERYLNVIELGPGVHGVAAAARHWFGKPATALTPREVAFLAALTPEPLRMSRRIAAAGALDPHSAERVDTVLRQMRRAGVISAAAAEAARTSTLALRPTALRTAIER